MEKVTGKGAGLSSVGLQRKITTIETAINKYKPDSQNIIEVLACVGGLDIAGLTGVCLGGAMYHVTNCFRWLYFYNSCFYVR